MILGGNPILKLDVLDSWIAIAKEVLAGTEGRQGQNHGGKRIRMFCRWPASLLVNGIREHVQKKRIEDVEPIDYKL
jgi:hypothetical protein